MPSEDSLGGEERPDLVCLSFGREIRRWLLRCGELAWRAPAVAEIIRQYISLLDQSAAGGFHYFLLLQSGSLSVEDAVARSSW